MGYVEKCWGSEISEFSNNTQNAGHWNVEATFLKTTTIFPGKLLQHPLSHLASGKRLPGQVWPCPFSSELASVLWRLEKSCPLSRAVQSGVDNRNTLGSPIHCPTRLSISFTLDLLPHLLMKVLWRTYTIVPLQSSRCWIQRGEKKKAHIPVDCKTCWTVLKISFASHKATRFWFSPNPNLFMEKVLISCEANWSITISKDWASLKT